MHFRLLQLRLVSQIRTRVTNGEVSERSLARLTGISQPHMHNVLKGKRLLSPQMADQVMSRLHIDLSDLLNTGAECTTGSLRANHAESREVTLLDGWIGPDHPYPHSPGPQRYLFPAADVEQLEAPLAARLAPDPRRTSILGGRGVVLLDCSERARRNPDREGYFALDVPDGGTVGLVRRAGRYLYMLSLHANRWHTTRLPDRDPLEVIQGRVSMLVLHL